MSITYFLPLLLIVISNTFYNIITKETPQDASPFLSLAVTYLVGVIFSFIFYFLKEGASNIMVDLKHLNWTSPVLGLCLIGLEAGYIYLYRVGWQISVGSIVGNILLALILLAIGILFYNETISLKQIIGILFCVVGLVFINLK